MTPRTRLSTTPVPAPLKTLLPLGKYHEYEEFVLGPDVDAVPFRHWTAHLRSFWGWYSEEPDYSVATVDLPSLRAMISDGLRIAGFENFAKEIEHCGTSISINRAVIAQYTSDRGLFEAVNRELRRNHHEEMLIAHPLTPWILQFNAGLRQLPIHQGPFFRGVQMPPEDIAAYTESALFEWSGFVSASIDPDVASSFEGNVMFEIVPGGSLSMYGKRNPYYIAEFSAYPEEREVVFPIACTYRTTAIERSMSSKTIIKIETIDAY